MFTVCTVGITVFTFNVTFSVAAEEDAVVRISLPTHCNHLTIPVPAEHGSFGTAYASYEYSNQQEDWGR
jgi:hypothetical protein